MLRQTRLVAALACALLLSGAGLAAAHEPLAGAPASALVAPAASPSAVGAGAPPARGALWPWLAPLVLLPVLLGRRTSKPVATALVVVLVVFAAESAVHSVHHGVAGERTAVCPVASAAAHVAGTDVETVAVAAPVVDIGSPLAETGPRAATLRPLGPHQGRAPPSALAA